MVLKTSSSFHRDKITWLAYGALSLFSFLGSMFGPALPFLREELDLNYAMAGLHTTSLAIGMIASSMVAPFLAVRLGRSTLLKGGGIGQALGAVLLITGRSPVQTMLATLVSGFCGGLVVMMVQAVLSDHHGERRDIALSEANIGAAIASTLAPLFVGGLQGLALGWRAAYLVGIACLVAISIYFPRQPARESKPSASGEPVEEKPLYAARLPAMFWLYWVVVFLVIAIEWSLLIWGADYLDQAVNMSKSSAAMTMSLFYLATVLARIIGSRLTHQINSRVILLASLLLSLVAFPILWASDTQALSVFALVIGGLGVSNLYPMAMAAALGVAPLQPDLASARIYLGLGTSVLISPLLLGALADTTGIQAAYGLIPGLILLAIGLLLISTRLRHRGVV
jgi:fucose permease